MTDPVQHRLDRLSGIAASLRDSGRALALLALGSAADTSRLDRWSDLDFFAIVQDGAKVGFVSDLWWLESIAPISWAYRNTADGWKVLYGDGVFLEFAVFEAAELGTIPFAPGRIVWQADGFDAGLCTPRQGGPPAEADPDWLMGEVLSNLYVGLCRWHRGERLAAMRSIQNHAQDALLRLESRQGAAEGAPEGDRFNPDRRLERRHPALAPLLSDMAPGIGQSPRAARAILDRLAAHRPVPEAMRQELLRLLEECPTAPPPRPPG